MWQCLTAAQPCAALPGLRARPSPGAGGHGLAPVPLPCSPRQGSAGGSCMARAVHRLLLIIISAVVLRWCHWWLSVWRGDVLNAKAELRAEDATNLLQCPEHVGRFRNWLETNFGLQFLVNFLCLESTCCVIWVRL